MSNDSKAGGMSIVRMVVALGLITIIAAVVLALTYEVTAEPIAEAASAQEVAAIESVTPEFDNNPMVDSVSFVLDGEQLPVIVYPAMLGGELVGAAVQTYSLDGFSGEIDLMVGFDIDGNIVDYQVLKHNETPGLGAKMDSWFRDSVGRRSVIGLDPADGKLFVAKDPGGEVDGITAATISSRAFLDAVRRASQAYNKYKTASN